MFSLSKKSTLIVEDFQEFARSVRAMLYSMGATNVDIVYNAEDAIKACAATKYDIILSDYNLGAKKDGQQLLEELIKNGQIKSNCIFLMLTAENNTAMVMGAIEYQPDSYLAKPFNGNLLQVRLKKSLEKKDTLLPINRAIANKKWDDALEHARTIQPKFPKYKMSCLRLQYRALLELKRYGDALQVASDIVAERSIPWAIEAVGQIYYLKEEYSRAQDIFKNMIKEFPMALEGYDWLAKVQHKLGNPIDAQETLVSAVSKSPKALHRQKKLGSLAEENDDIDVMATAYRNAVKYSANSAFATPDEYLKLTKALSIKIERSADGNQKVLIAEAESAFDGLGKHFLQSNANLLRNHVAQSSFYTKVKQTDKAQVHLEKTSSLMASQKEQLPATVSLELSETLNDIGKTDLAETILNEAIQQNLDDQAFIEKASKLSNNHELIKICQQARQYNNKAIGHFSKKQYKESSEWFQKSLDLSPQNINIRLNCVQSLLKENQTTENSVVEIKRAENLINEMPQISLSDLRYKRYSELARLIQLALQSHSEHR